ncbi:histone-lysine N-methyltransferase SETMAR [Trichonephila clavipes]|nr:histone-lysine N-methyltransferase SETMAR [Trichonephila clavipes]
MSVDRYLHELIIEEMLTVYKERNRFVDAGKMEVQDLVSRSRDHEHSVTAQQSELDISKELVRGGLLYDFKVGLSSSASSRRICQVFGDSAVNERMARHWFQKFRSGDLCLSDKARTGRPWSWMTKPCRRLLRRTAAKRVVNLPDNSTLPVKWLDFICTAAVSDRGWLVTSSSPLPLKIRRVGERCSLNLSRAQTSSRWWGVLVRRMGASSGLVLVT